MRLIMDSGDGQLELDLNPDDLLIVEDITLNADRVLIKAVGEYEHVFVLGVDKEGFSYRSDHTDALFWLHALERARQFIMRTI